MSLTAAFDLDGTLADYSGELARRMNKIRAESEHEYPPDHFDNKRSWPDFVEERRSLITSVEEFWTSLPVLPDGLAILKVLESMSVRVFILSKGPRSKPEAWSGKHKWATKHFPHLPLNVVSGKAEFDADILVDDYPAYIADWLAKHPNGLAIAPARPWNRELDGAPNVLRVTMPADESILREAIAHVRLKTPPRVSDLTVGALERILG